MGGRRADVILLSVPCLRTACRRMGLQAEALQEWNKAHKQESEMKILELFCGTKSISNAFKEAGHEVFTVDWEKDFNPSLRADISTSLDHPSDS